MREKHKSENENEPVFSDIKTTRSHSRTDLKPQECSASCKNTQVLQTSLPHLRLGTGIKKKMDERGGVNVNRMVYMAFNASKHSGTLPHGTESGDTTVGLYEIRFNFFQIAFNFFQKSVVSVFIFRNSVFYDPSTCCHQKECLIIHCTVQEWSYWTFFSQRNPSNYAIAFFSPKLSVAV